MGDRKAAGTSPSPTNGRDDDHARIAAVLNSEAWQKRLEEARRQRQRILAEKAARGAPVSGGLRAAAPPAPGIAAPDVVRVAAAPEALREAKPLPGAVVLPFDHRAAKTTAPTQAPPAPAATRPALQSTARDVRPAPRPIPPLPPAAAEPAAAPGRLETALGRGRTGGTDMAPHPGPRRDWRVLSAGVFALGLTVAIGATWLPPRSEHGVTVARGTGAPVEPARAPAAGASGTAAAAGDRQGPLGPSDQAAARGNDDLAFAPAIAPTGAALPLLDPRPPGRGTWPSPPAAAPVAVPAMLLPPGVTEIAAPVPPDPASPDDATTVAPPMSVARPALPALAAPRSEPGDPALATAVPAPPSLLADLVPLAGFAGPPEP